jgi:hypothetical protein
LSGYTADGMPSIVEAMSLFKENLIRELEKRLGRDLSVDEKRLLLLAEEITEVEKRKLKPKPKTASKSASK